MKRKNIFLSLILVGVLSIAVVPLASCMGASSTAGTMAKETTEVIAAETTAVQTPAAKNEISIKGNAFSPDILGIKVGDTVTWVNNDSYAHTVKAKTGEFDSGNIASSAKFSFTFNKEGTIDYICGIHTFMTGKIVVTK
jgi:plastocyanin